MNAGAWESAQQDPSQPRSLRYSGLTLDASLWLAWRDDEEIRFTRQERSILALLVQNPGQLVSRQQIIDALSADGSRISGGSTDVHIHRLRDKLGDDARNPRFIASRRGIGYLWIARPAATEAPFVLVGPCFGLADPATAEVALPFLEKLARRLAATLPDTRPVSLQAAAGEIPASARFQLETWFHTEDQQLHTACVLRDGGRQIGCFRARATGSTMQGVVRNLVEDLHRALWDHLAAR